MYLCLTQIPLGMLPFDVGIDSNIKQQSIYTGSSTTVMYCNGNCMHPAA